MIPKEELRIGNYYSDNEIYFKVSEILYDGTVKCIAERDGQVITVTSREPMPILITEKEFERLGGRPLYELGELHNDILAISVDACTPVIQLQFRKGKVEIIGSEFRYDTPELIYVHQLQNFYYAHTGKDIFFS